VHEKCTSAFRESQLTCQSRSKKKALSAAATTVPSLAELYNCKGLALYHSSQYEEAIVTFTTAAGLAQSGTTPSPSQGGLQYSSIATQVTKQLTDPTNQSAVVPQYTAIANRGLCHFYLENLDRAVDDLSQAIEHGVANEQTFSTRATAFQLLGKDDLAQADRRQALLYNPRAIVKVRDPIACDVRVCGVSD
jgi:Tfp pilus assembly protein PilF